jgi:hypothetical protein
LLHIEHVKFANIPFYDELSVRYLWRQVEDDQNILKYFPDMKDGSKLPNREYFFAVLNTIEPTYLKTLIDNA